MKDRNFKDNLMRTAHARGAPLPVYVSEQRVETSDDKRYKVFYVTATMDGHVGYGKGCTKKEAEQAAAKDALVKMGIPLDD
jgi:dsRNA-specific ribonuclease